jgi:hypothetical protein
MVAMGWPEMKTIWLGEVGMAEPPCAHCTVAPRHKMDDGIGVPFYDPTMVSAVPLMDTVLPTRLMVAVPLLI